MDNDNSKITGHEDKLLQDQKKIKEIENLADNFYIYIFR
jgi:hypothetical protein